MTGVEHVGRAHEPTERAWAEVYGRLRGADPSQLSGDELDALGEAAWWQCHTEEALEELELPPPPQGRPGIFALADGNRLARMVEGAGFRDVEAGTLNVVYVTAAPQDFTTLVRESSPPITNLVAGQRPEVAERVWQKVTAAWQPFTTAQGTRIPCEAIWVAGTRPPRGLLGSEEAMSL